MSIVTAAQQQQQLQALANAGGGTRARRVDLPDIDPANQLPQGATGPRLVNANPMLISIGDKLDVGLCFQRWLAANDAAVASAVVAGHAQSPAAPAIMTNGWDEDEKCAVAVIDATGKPDGETYYLEAILQINDATTGGSFDLVGREIRRTFSVMVVA